MYYTDNESLVEDTLFNSCIINDFAHGVNSEQLYFANGSTASQLNLHNTEFEIDPRFRTGSAIVFLKRSTRFNEVNSG